MGAAMIVDAARHLIREAVPEPAPGRITGGA
jgi:hypothetical protein